jgi:5'(3')-deoxyribonucleotidase
LASIKDKKIIAVDVDDVCLDLVTNWVKKFNKDYQKNFKKEIITDWDIGQFLSPLEKINFFEYIKDDEVYLTADPVDNALDTILWLKEKYRIIYITAVDPQNCKFKWLLDHGFIEDEKDLVIAYDKNLIKSAILIDDKYENVKERNGGWLFSQPWNEKYKFKNRITSWANFKEKITKGIIRL